MTTSLAKVCWAVMLGLWMGVTSQLAAQDFGDSAGPERDPEDSLYYQPPAYHPDTRALIHQKAQARAYQRQSRLASLSWYGMSNARPTAALTPFTTLYSPVWQMPGGRPFAWHTYGWPTYVVYVR
jgi:hypothetical protein